MKIRRPKVNLFKYVIIMSLLYQTFNSLIIAKEIEAPDVYAKTELCLKWIEHIRIETGSQNDDREDIMVFNAKPREVYYQALTLLDKVNQLHFEQLSQRIIFPKKPIGNITSHDVHTIVIFAINYLQKIVEKTDITLVQIEEPKRDSAKTSTDVIKSIIKANRKMNFLIKNRYIASNVFEKLTISIDCLSIILREFPSVLKRIPEEPTYESGKFPIDVYKKLMDCFALIEDIFNSSNLSLLKFDQTCKLSTIYPSDVYDIASLIVSELDYLRKKINITETPKSYFPGKRFPSHSYQRALIIEKQLNILKNEIIKQPGWIEKSSKE